MRLPDVSIPERPEPRIVSPAERSPEQQTVLQWVGRRTAQLTEWAFRPKGLTREEWARIQEVHARMMADSDETNPSLLSMDRWNASQQAYMEALEVACPQKAADPRVRAAVLGVPSIG